MSAKRTIHSLEEENFYLSEKVHAHELEIMKLTRELNKARTKGQRRFSLRRILNKGVAGIR